jgi:glycosyltransferase involved in cell wall biosynthesis
MATKQTTWAIITGEYPPQPGGVSDYTWIVAHALHAAGDEVHVFVPGTVASELESPVNVHRLSDRFGLRGMRQLYAGLTALPTPRRALLQFVVQSFGMRAMNLPFMFFLRQLRGYPLWIMFHEFAIRDNPAAPLRRRVHALATRVAARVAAQSADSAFVSTSAWRSDVQRAASAQCTLDWLPVPSNISTHAEPGEVRRLNAMFRDAADGTVVGHFGSYRMRESVSFLEAVIPALAWGSPTRRFLLLGRGSDTFAATLIAKVPELAGRLFGTGDLAPQDLANCLSVCDVLLQPYEDGVTTRRGSLIAGLALGIPAVTNAGVLSEDIWPSSGAVLLAPPGDTAAMMELAEKILSNPTLRGEMAVRARYLYRCYFDVEHTIRHLRATNP